MRPRVRQRPVMTFEQIAAAAPPTGVSDELRAFVAANERPRPAPRSPHEFTATEDKAIAALTDALRQLTRWSPEAIYVRARHLGLRLDEMPEVDRWIDALATLDEDRAVAVHTAAAARRSAAIEAEWATPDNAPHERL